MTVVIAIGLTLSMVLIGIVAGLAFNDYKYRKRIIQLEEEIARLRAGVPAIKDAPRFRQRTAEQDPGMQSRVRTARLRAKKNPIPKQRR
jgi:hypothetical protein